MRSALSLLLTAGGEHLSGVTFICYHRYGGFHVVRRGSIETLHTPTTPGG
jgi:hypothetical protein